MNKIKMKSRELIRSRKCDRRKPTPNTHAENPSRKPTQNFEQTVITGLLDTLTYGPRLPMVVVSLLPHPDLGPNNHRKETPHFT